MADAQRERQRWRAEMWRRREAHVRALARRADAADDDAQACADRLAAVCLAQRYLRDLAHGRGSPDEHAAHRDALQAMIDDAESRLAAADPAVVRAARRRQGVRLAVVGKGGTGKSLIAGTLARLLARRGRSVLACDFDTNPGLAYSIGVAVGQGTLADAVLAEQPGAPYGWGLRGDVDPAQVVADHTTAAPDGVRFVSVGKIGDVDKEAPKRTIGALQEVVAGFADPRWDVIGDLEAGPSTPFMRYHAFADRVLLTVSPTWVSAMTGRRLLTMLDDAAVDVVANQWQDEEPHPDLAPRVRLPYDGRLADAEHEGVAPLDACPDSPLVAALDRFVDQLTTQEVPV